MISRRRNCIRSFGTYLSPFDSSAIIFGIKNIRPTRFGKYPIGTNIEKFLRRLGIGKRKTPIESHPASRSRILSHMKKIVCGKKTLFAIDLGLNSHSEFALTGKEVELKG